jgi:hypothetical protein
VRLPTFAQTAARAPREVPAAQDSVTLWDVDVLVTETGWPGAVTGAVTTVSDEGARGSRRDGSGS